MKKQRKKQNNDAAIAVNKKLLLSFFLLLYSVSLYAEVLLKTSTTWEGGEIIYPKGKAEITSLKLVIPKGKVSEFHCHPIPTLGYVIKGELEVETADGKKIILHEGDSAVEVLNTVHRGRAINGGVEVVVFYAGAEDIPHTVLPKDDTDGIYCK